MEVDIDIAVHHIYDGKNYYIESQVIVHIPSGILTFNLDVEETKRFMKTINNELKKYKELTKKEVE